MSVPSIDQPPPPSFSPPFSAKADILANTATQNSQHQTTRTITLPATYQDQHSNIQEVDQDDPAKLSSYLIHELSLARLNTIHKQLWLAGRPTHARSLHRQLLLSRQIMIVEQCDLHLVWSDCRIFVKPLPDFLLSRDFWSSHLCRNEELHEAASGLLLSYLWLIVHPSDLEIAREKGLISKKVTWETWVIFSKSLMHHVNYTSLAGVNKRYQYGELRLNRLNWIYRIPHHSRPYSLTMLIRGYMYGYNRYSVFLETNFAWLLVAFIYITVVLTAMQVGLATDRLRENKSFQSASYGFTVFSILSPLVGLGIMGIVLTVLILFNLVATRKFKRKTERERQKSVVKHTKGAA